MDPLPRFMLLTDRFQTPDLASTVAAAAEGGCRAVVLREKDLPQPDRLAIALELSAVLPDDALLIVASDATIPADGLHLSSHDPFVAAALVGRSWHRDEPVDSVADYLTLSPVFPSASKPGYGPPLGPDVFRTLPADAPPVYALGGLTPGRTPACLDAGAYGVAVMGDVMHSADPAERVAQYLEAMRCPR